MEITTYRGILLDGEVIDIVQIELLEFVNYYTFPAIR